MRVSTTQVDKILRGSQTFSQLGFSMMLTRMKGQYAKDPAKLKDCTAEINAFLSKFSTIMAADYAIIEKIS